MRTTLANGTPVEVARPDGAPSRGLVVAPDIGGLRPLFDDLVARLAAEQGWAVAAVEPFPGREDLSLQERMTSAAPSLRDVDTVADLVAAADLLDVEPVGIVGFCMGGMWTMKAVSTDRFAAGVAFYGMIRSPNWHSAHNAHAIDLLTAVPGSAQRLLAVIGTADSYTPADDVADLEALGATVARYEGAEHGFVHDPSRDVHRPDDAADAWARAIDWLTSHG